jgi:hypothetical protein
MKVSGRGRVICVSSCPTVRAAAPVLRVALRQNVNYADALPKMDSVQEHQERRVGDQLIEWAIAQVMRDPARPARKKL